MSLFPPPQDLVVVHEATSEFEVIAVRDALEAAGIAVMVRSRLLPGYEVPIMVRGEAGVYADMMVLRRDEDRASRVIAEYLAALRAATEESQ